MFWNLLGRYILGKYKVEKMFKLRVVRVVENLYMFLYREGIVFVNININKVVVFISYVDVLKFKK